MKRLSVFVTMLLVAVLSMFAQSENKSLIQELEGAAIQKARQFEENCSQLASENLSEGQQKMLIQTTLDLFLDTQCKALTASKNDKNVSRQTIIVLLNKIAKMHKVPFSVKSMKYYVITLDADKKIKEVSEGLVNSHGSLSQLARSTKMTDPVFEKYITRMEIKPSTSKDNKHIIVLGDISLQEAITDKTVMEPNVQDDLLKQAMARINIFISNSEKISDKNYNMNKRLLIDTTGDLFINRNCKISVANNGRTIARNVKTLLARLPVVPMDDFEVISFEYYVIAVAADECTVVSKNTIDVEKKTGKSEAVTGPIDLGNLAKSRQYTTSKDTEKSVIYEVRLGNIEIRQLNNTL